MTPPAAPPLYRVVLVSPRTGRRKLLPGQWSNFYRAVDIAAYHEGRGERSGRPVRAEIVTARAAAGSQS